MDETQAKLLAKGVIVLPEEIDHAAYVLMVEALLESADRDVRLYCRGDGGGTWAAMAIIDLIRAHGQVTGLLPSMAASSHGVIWAACPRRYVYPSGRLGIHKIAWNAIDTRQDSHSLNNIAAEWQQSEQEIAAIYAAASNKTQREWYAAMQSTGSSGLRTFTAPQLIALGMARPIDELQSPQRAVERLAWPEPGSRGNGAQS